MFKIEIKIYHSERLVDSATIEDSRLSKVLLAIKKWLDEIGPY